MTQGMPTARVGSRAGPVSAPHTHHHACDEQSYSPGRERSPLGQAHDLRPLGCDFGRSLRDGLSDRRASPSARSNWSFVPLP